jgi:hypothetical protein
MSNVIPQARQIEADFGLAYKQIAISRYQIQLLMKMLYGSGI